LPAEPPAPPAHSAPEPTCEAVGRIADLLAASTRPLILVGRGATIPDGRPLIGELAERIGALIGTTLLAKDAFRGHRYNLGVVGGFASDAASTLLADVDCVLALGASLNDFTTADGTLFADVPVIHIDADRAVLGRNFSAALPVVADARSTVVSLLARLPERGADSKPFHRPAVIDALVGPLYRGLDESSDGELDVRVVVAILDELLPDDRVVVLDGGRFMAAPGRYVHVPGPDAFRLTADFGSIGVGLGVAMGAAVAGRGDPTVLFVGDGGLSAVLGDLATAAKENLALLVVVMNDSCWGQERTTARAKELPLEICDLADVDFAGVAAALGIEAATVRTVAELRKLAPRFAGRASPLLLDCKISRDIAAAQLRWPLDPMAAELPPLC
jgi:thiamine pyrophosphate-dependent acetolactate synthase large subunit-like protein